MFERHNEALCELLKNQGLVRAAELEGLRQRSLTTGASVAEVAVEQGLVSKTALLAAVARHLGAGPVANPPGTLEPSCLDLLPADLAHRHGVIPLRCHGRMVELLALDPFDREIVPDLTFALGREVRLLVGDPQRVADLIRTHYGEPVADSGRVGRGKGTGEPGGETAEPSVTELEAQAGQAPVIQWVNQILAQAIRERASDIHFEPFEREFRIRYRVDGVLQERPPPPKALALPLASRLKMLAELNIAERRLPQDGRIRTTLEGRSVDLRVSTLPTQFGESIVLRVLDQSAVRLELGQLGLPAEVLAGVQDVIRRPNGIVVVTGPTGSGKTTTLYSGLRAIHAPGLKLLTAEDPVEYEIEGIMQVPVNPAAGLTFGTALRAFLRQDPDVIMVGEIRDLETARIAIQASLTGHLVLSTLHTNDAPAAVTRLLDLGVEAYLLATTLEGVLAQRLVRRICPACRVAWDPPPELRRQAGLTADQTGYRGRGCAACAQTGYRGRLGLYEWLPMTEGLRELITEEAPAGLIRQQAQRQGLRTLREEGRRAALAGDTTLEEVLRHT